MYATGAASNVSAVLQALATFAASAGWTMDQSAATGTGGADWILQMHNTAGSYVQMYAHEAAGANQYTIEVNGGTGIASSSTLTNQSPSCFCQANAGPFTAYHFFSKSSASPYLHILIELSSNLYADIFCGKLNAVGGASPAVYVCVSAWTYTGFYPSFYDSGYGVGNNLPFHAQSNYQVFGVTVDSVLRWFMSSAVGSTPARTILPLYNQQGSQYDGIVRSPNTYNELSPLFSFPIIVERATGNIYSYVGDVPDLRGVNMANFTPKDEITIGSDVWKIFPFIQKSVPWNTGNAPASSGPYGVALLKSA
jgi:hypothetical protein